MQEHRSRHARDDARTQGPGLDGRVLLIEDDADWARLVEHVMSQRPHPPGLVHAETGRAALKRVERARSLPALVLLDVEMPGKSGHEVLKSLRSRPRFATTPIVVWTSSPDPSLVERSLEAGANSHVAKPVNFDELRERLETVLDYWLSVDEAGHRGTCVFDSNNQEFA
jgi:CheY-like chemotaxis protein